MVIMNFGPALVFLFFWFLMIRQMQGGGKQAMAFGRSKAKLQSGKKSKITFADVAGCDEAKEELREIIEFPGKTPAKFAETWRQDSQRRAVSMGLPVRGKPSWPRRLPEKRGFPSFHRPEASSSKCLSASGPAASGIFLTRAAKMRLASCSWMRSMPWDVTASRGSAVATTSVSRR